MTSRETILVLVDEIGKAGLRPESRFLVEGLRQHLDVVVVARCYLQQSHHARRLPCQHELYGFGATDFDAKVVAFASAIATRCKPSWIISHGWENPLLATAFDRLDLPLVCYVDKSPGDRAAEDQLHVIFRLATTILIGNGVAPETLGAAGRTLEARENATTFIKASSAQPTPKRSFRSKASATFGLTGSRAMIDVAPVVSELCELGRQAAEFCRQAIPIMVRDRTIIDSASTFNADLYRSGHALQDQTEGVADYLRASRRAMPRDRPLAGRLLRRPAAGFNPLIYASENPDFDEMSGEDPLAHFLRNGRIAGRWRHDVIGPTDEAGQAAAGRFALHVHLHYPDLLSDLLDRLSANRSKVALFVTLTSPDAQADVEQLLLRFDVRYEIFTCENVGRDLWPFLDLLSRGAFDGYQVVGHVHGKRSPSYSSGGVWRDFLWRHLIGRDERMMDTILIGFAEDPKVGLVFAEDAHLDGWENNYDLATGLAERTGIALPLPNHFDYPMGNMFWARPAALAPLRALGLTRGEMPEEPVPNDGTILHALERLLPFFAEKAGFSFATTHVPGSAR